MNGPPKRSFALVKNKLGYHPNTSGSIIHNRTLIIGMVFHAHGGIDCPQRTFEPLPPMLELLDPPPHGGTIEPPMVELTSSLLLFSPALVSSHKS